MCCKLRWDARVMQVKWQFGRSEEADRNQKKCERIGNVVFTWTMAQINWTKVKPLPSVRGLISSENAISKFSCSRWLITMVCEGIQSRTRRATIRRNWRIGFVILWVDILVVVVPKLESMWYGESAQRRKWDQWPMTLVLQGQSPRASQLRAVLMLQG